MKKPLISVFLTFAVSGAIFGQVPQIETGVSRELAKWRAENYSEIFYKLEITLEKMSPTLRGTAEISLFNKGDLIILDWRKLKGKEDSSRISNLSVNGRTAYFEELDGHLILKEGVLKNRLNTIRFDFTSPITGGANVKRFVDEKDGAEYVYSQFSANAENTAFPAFEQSDLKARFSLSLIVPTDWQAVSNSNILREYRIETTHCSENCEQRKPVYFPTNQISINAFAFAAGDFEVFKECFYSDNWKGKEKTACLEKTDDPETRDWSKIYVRRSQAGKFKQYAADYFRLTHKADKSAKLDIILLPEVFNLQNDYDGVKFMPENSVFK